MYYIDKAVGIDADNVLYWKRYAKINRKLQNFEEAEHGYRRTIELGNYEIDTWLSRCDILIELGEYEAARKNLLQAIEFYPEHPEIEFRMAGLCFMLHETNKAQFHLVNALHLDSEFVMILEILFPEVYRLKLVQELIQNHQKPSV